MPDDSSTASISRSVIVTERIGNKDVLGSGIMLAESGTPIEINITESASDQSPMKLRIEFVADDSEMHRIEPAFKSTNELTIYLFNFLNKSSSGGTKSPIPIGVFEDRKLWMLFWVSKRGQQTFTFEYTLLLDGETVRDA
jgi:hypothetical protein